MANKDHVAVVKGGAEAIKKWREENPTSMLDLSDERFEPPVNLAYADLSRAVLDGTVFAGIDMSYANFKNATFRIEANRSVGQQLSRFDNVILRHANFSDSIGFDSVVGLNAKQLAGVNLNGLNLPKSVDIDTLRSLADVSNHVRYTRNLFLTMIVTCIYSFLSVWSASDTNIIIGNKGLILPILNVSLPITSFFVFTPIVILAIYVYFLLYLQNLFERLSLAPAVFPDGKTLDEQADPWIVLSFIRLYLTGIELKKRDRWQHLLIVFLVWWLVPITLSLFWYKYLIARNILPFLSLLICFIGSIILRGKFYYSSINAIVGNVSSKGHPSSKISSEGKLPTFGYILILACLVFMKLMLPFLWGGNMQHEILHGANLRGMDLRHANLLGADLSDSSLQFANLESACLVGANLTKAKLDLAILAEADLRHTNLTETELSSTDLTRVNMSYGILAKASLDSVKLTDAILDGVDFTEAVVPSVDWDEEVRKSSKTFNYAYWSVAARKNKEGSTIYVVVPPVEAKKP